MRTSLLRFLLVLLLLGGAASAVTAQASAASRTVVVPVQIDWRIHQITNGCSLVGLVAWREQKGSRGWTLDYRVDGNRQIKPLDSSSFDDAEYEAYGWRPDPGMHWAAIYHAAHGGANAENECAEDLPVLRARYSKVRVRITVDPVTSIVGVVQAPGGIPLQGVRVGAGGHAARTDAKGRYSIELPKKSGKYRVRAAKRGFSFRPRAKRISVQPSQTRRANFRAQGYVIFGRVTQRCPDASASSDGSDTPKPQCKPGVGGAKVEAKKAGPGKVVASGTAPDGTFVIVVQEKGTYVVKFSVDGKTWRQKKKVRRNKVKVSQDIGNRNAVPGLVVR